MSGTAFLYRMPSGIPGDVNRTGAFPTIEPQVITPSGTTGHPAAFGLGIKIDATTHQVRTVTTGDTVCDGFLVRAYPFNSTQNGLGTSTPQLSGPCEIMKRGYMTVKLGGSTAAVKQGVVYLWISASSGAHVQGQVEAANPSSDGFVIPGAYFTGPADADGNVEIAFNI